ncbi:MAG: hypothetical protein WCK27_00785 [Verrucomicrobiota bacterium]
MPKPPAGEVTDTAFRTLAFGEIVATANAVPQPRNSAILILLGRPCSGDSGKPSKGDPPQLRNSYLHSSPIYVSNLFMYVEVRRAHITHPLLADSARIFTRDIVNGWNQKINNRLDLSINTLKAESEDREIFQFRDYGITLESSRRATKNPVVSPLIEIINQKQLDECAPLHEYRIFAGIGVLSAPPTILPQRIGKQRPPAPLVALFVQNPGSLACLPSDDQIALRVSIPYDLEQVWTVLHDLALDFYCCMQFLARFLRPSDYANKEQLRALGECKTIFFTNRRNKFYGLPIDLKGNTWYVPFTSACRDSLTSPDSPIFYRKLLDIWKDFRDYFSHREIPNPKFVTRIHKILHPEDVLKVIQTDKYFRKVYKQLPLGTVKIEISSQMAKHGIGDYVFIIPTHRPKRHYHRELVARKVLARNGTWSKKLWAFQPMKRRGYSDISPYVIILVFRFLPPPSKE